MTVFLTGATGYVGGAVYAELLRRDHVVVPLVRAGSASRMENAVELPESVSELSDLPFAAGDSLIHLAGIAHRRGSTKDEFDSVNHELVVNLAKVAAKAEVGCFLFVSTAKVLGDRTTQRSGPLTVESPYDPTDEYSHAKVRAETDLLHQFRDSSMAIEIVRPPLVVGENAKGNLALIRKFASARIPFPVPREPNRRTTVSLQDLAETVCDLMEHAVPGRCAVNLCGSVVPTSTADLVQSMTSGGRTLPVPVSILRTVSTPIHRLAGVDISALFEDFELVPGRATIYG